MLVTPIIGDGVGMLKPTSIAHPMPVAPATYFVRFGQRYWRHAVFVCGVGLALHAAVVGVLAPCVSAVCGVSLFGRRRRFDDDYFLSSAGPALRVSPTCPHTGVALGRPSWVLWCRVRRAPRPMVRMGAMVYIRAGHTHTQMGPPVLRVASRERSPSA